jgi:hypothetical protein
MSYTYEIVADANDASSQALMSLGGGAFKQMVIEVTPDAATGNVTVTELAKAASIIYLDANFTLEADLSANCLAVQGGQDGTTANKFNFKFWSAAGAAATVASHTIRVKIIYI